MFNFKKNLKKSSKKIFFKDPAAKRYLWTVINKARDLGMKIVLTSHSMEDVKLYVQD